MSVPKYIFFSLSLMLVGVLVVGVPTLIKSSQYYARAESLDDKLIESTNKLNMEIQQNSTLMNDLNRVKKNYNRVLSAIELYDKELPSGYSYETCRDDFFTTEKCT